MLRGLRAVAAKEVIHVRRDPAALAISVLLPIVQLTIFGYALDTDVKHIRTAVYDLDHRPASRQFVERMEATQYYSVVEYVNSDGALQDSIVAGRAKVGVKIPPGYSEKLLRGETAQIVLGLPDWPHLYVTTGVGGKVSVSVAGDLTREELARIAGSLHPIER